MTSNKLTKRACFLALMFSWCAILLTITSSVFAQEEFFTFTQLLEDDVDGADGLRSANAIAVSPDGKHLYVVSTGDFSIALYRRNITSGTISFVEMWRDRVGGVEGLDDPYHIVISPDGEHVYVGAYDGKTISVFDRNSSTGSLSFKQVFDLGVRGYGPINFMALSPDGKDLFAVSSYSHNYLRGLSQLKRDVVTGELSWLRWYEGKWGTDISSPTAEVNSVSVSSNGQFVYVTAQGHSTSSLSVLSRNSPNQELVLIEHELHRDGASDGLSNPGMVLSSPDSAFLYVLDEGFPRGIAAYAQNLTTGEIDFVNFTSDLYASRAVMTKDGSHIMAFDNWAIVAFERNQSTGRLNFIERIAYDDLEVGNHTVLIHPKWISVSPDGAFVYVSNDSYHMLGVFKTKAGSVGVQEFQINPGLNDAWFYPATDGQGFFITVFPDLGKVSLAWFTYDTEHPPVGTEANFGDPGHRWLTALGRYANNQAVLTIKIASGGLFDTIVAEAEVTRVNDGTIILTFDSCNSGTVEYDIPSINRQGIVPIRRITNDNIVICEALSSE